MERSAPSAQTSESSYRIQYGSIWRESRCPTLVCLALRMNYSLCESCFRCWTWWMRAVQLLFAGKGACGRMMDMFFGCAPEPGAPRRGSQSVCSVSVPDIAVAPASEPTGRPVTDSIASRTITLVREVASYPFSYTDIKYAGLHSEQLSGSVDRVVDSKVSDYALQTHLVPPTERKESLNPPFVHSWVMVCFRSLFTNPPFHKSVVIQVPMLILLLACFIVCESYVLLQTARVDGPNLPNGSTSYRC